MHLFNMDEHAPILQSAYVYLRIDVGILRDVSEICLLQLLLGLGLRVVGITHVYLPT